MMMRCPHCRPKTIFAFFMAMLMSSGLYYLFVDLRNSKTFYGWNRRHFSSVQSALQPSLLHPGFETFSKTTVISPIVTSSEQGFIFNVTVTPPLNRSYTPANNSESNIRSIAKLLNFPHQHHDYDVTVFKSESGSTGKNYLLKSDRESGSTGKNYLPKPDRVELNELKDLTEIKLIHGTASKGENANDANTATQIQKTFPEINNLTVKEQSSKTGKPKVVIIFTTKRSGSSFVGEFFNRHPDVYYNFEPLHPIQGIAIARRMSNEDFLKTSLQVIKGLFHCDFHTGNLLRFASEKFYVSNLQLFKNNLCKRKEDTLPLSFSKVKLWEQECKKHKMVVMKLIRINNLEDLKPLLTQIDLEWRIILLVRDPRPTKLSRKRSGRNYDLIRRNGQTLQRNLKYWLDTPTWLKGRFKMTRFEDIAASPLETAKELLQFSGLDLADEVVAWIQENTVREKKSLMKKRTFSTSRNSSKVLEGWRHYMDWKLVQRIQNVCSVAMTSLGYALIPDMQSLRDLSIPSP